MKNDKREAYVSRDTVMKLLSDDEVARVSTAETQPSLPSGAEYLDLEKIQLGVQRAGAAKLTMGHVVPRSAVSAATWTKIVEHVATSTREAAV